MSYRNAIAEPPPARAGRPRDEERDRALLDAAIELVAEVGYDRMTMDAVAARARASKATIYRRWPGKAELVVDAVRHLVGEPEALVSGGELRADLVTLLRSTRDAMEGQTGDLVVGLAVAARRDPALATAIRTQFHDEKLCPTTASLVAGAVERGELPAGARSGLLDELVPALILFRQIQGEETGDDHLAGIVDDILLPLLSRPPAVPGSPAGSSAAAPAGDEPPAPATSTPTPPRTLREEQRS